MGPNVGAILGDAIDTVRKRPALAVGAGVAVLVAMRYFGGDTAPAADAAPVDASSGDGGLLGGGLGSIDYSGLPTNGGLVDSGVVTTPTPAPAPAPTPAPKPKVAVLRATLAAGTYTTYSNVGGRAKATGTLRTGGTSFDCRALTLVQSDGSGTVGMIVGTSGQVANGKMLRRAAPGVSVYTVYR